MVRQRASRTCLQKALAEGKGFVYWLDEAGGRQQATADVNYHRRCVCPDCVTALFNADEPAIADAAAVRLSPLFSDTPFREFSLVLRQPAPNG